MIHESSTDIAAPPAVIFAIYSDVGAWHTWDPDTQSAALDGPFAVGTRGTLTPTKGRAVPMRIVALSADRSFTVECRIPLFCMWFEHELTPTAAGTRVTQRLRTSGLLRLLLDPVIGKQVRDGFPKTLASLKQRAEARQAQAAAS